MYTLFCFFNLIDQQDELNKERPQTEKKLRNHEWLHEVMLDRSSSGIQLVRCPSCIKEIFQDSESEEEKEEGISSDSSSDSSEEEQEDVSEEDSHEGDDADADDLDGDVTVYPLSILPDSNEEYPCVFCNYRRSLTRKQFLSHKDADASVADYRVDFRLECGTYFDGGCRTVVELTNNEDINKMNILQSDFILFNKKELRKHTLKLTLKEVDTFFDSMRRAKLTVLERKSMKDKAQWEKQHVLAKFMLEWRNGVI